MLLRRFEAYGFKSFADRVEIEFGKGVTAIVGPNGSGKSNISDAIRWVLGEQNIRNLRGAKTEDIIFAGSTARRPLNVAEVSLVFDNSDKKIPLDFNEVIISRRAYRSGENEYMINKAACRLKDIHDLLADIGLGRESMAIISQSKIDEVLNSRPEERRLLFEDAAGITKYKQRKRDSLRKIEDTEANIVRVADIMAELGAQLEPLAASAARTEQYNAYYRELTACQSSLLLHKLDRAQAMLKDIASEKEAQTDQLIGHSSRLATAEANIETLVVELADIDQQLRACDEEIAATAAQLEQTDNRIAVLQERVVQKRLAAERVNQDLTQFTDRKQKAEMEYSGFVQELTKRRQGINQAEQEVKLTEEQLAAIMRSIAEKEAELAAASDSIFASLQETSAQRNLCVNLERDLARCRTRHSQLLKERQDYESKLRQTKEQCGQFAAELNSQNDSLNALTQELENISAAKTAAEQIMEETRAKIGQLDGQVAQKQSRLTILANMQRDLEGYSRGNKSVLTSKAPWRQGICGAVAQVIEVQPRYLTAIEVALGGALQDIITTDENTAKAAIAYLKQQNAGRVTFLPISTIKPRPASEVHQRAAASKGAVGNAAELVSCDSRYRAIIDHLLGRVIVAENLDAALAIARQFAFSLKIVTLDGELINPGGAITGGSLARRESSILGRTGEIHSLEQTIIQLRQQQQQLHAQLHSLAQQNASLSQQESDITRRRQEISIRQAQLAAYHEQAGTDISRIAAALQTVEFEIKQIEHDATQLEQKLEQAKTVIASLEQLDASRKQAIAVTQADVRTMQLQKDELAALVTDKKIVLSALKQEIQSLEQMRKTRLADIEEITARITALAAEREQIVEEIAAAEQESQALSLKRQELALRKQSQDQQRLTLLGRKAAILADQQQAEKDCRELRRRVNTLEARLHELNLMLTRYELEAANSLTQLQEQYLLTVEQARAMQRPDDPQKLMARSKELEAAIAALGPVNPAAIEEYARVKERYGFLERQYQDLLTAKEHLAAIIQDIDNTMAKRFTTAFEAINNHFGEIFPRLFGGGKAKMELSDPDNILNSGIEIYVQPPGKKQQNLALLSGGERALTVISLLFSLLAYRPSPFAVVDEIDAALDEANVQRFSEFLREFCVNTQFIIVTHRKGTMEAADCMHGVTMEESGVSRIVSVRFMDKAG